MCSCFRIGMKIILFVNSAKTFFWHRKSLADLLHHQGHEVVVVSSTDGDVSGYSKLPYRVILIPLSRKGLNFFSELRIFLRLVGIFWKERPAVAHNFTIKCVIYGSFAQKITGVPTVVNSITGLGYVFLKGGIIQKFAELLYKSAFLFSSSRVIFQNREDYFLFVKKGIVEGRQTVLVSGSGVNTSTYKPSSNHSDSTTVLFAGRLLKSKGLRECVEASKMLFGKGVRHNLFIAGELDTGNPDSFSLEELETLLSGCQHIHSLGAVEDMPKLYESSQIACLPSYREGLSKFLIESASSGLPIVTTDAPGCADVVVNENGFQVPVGAVSELADALRKLIESPTLREQMGRKSRELACSQFDERIILSKIQRLYDI